MNKNASVRDVVLIVAFLFVSGLLFLIFYYVADQSVDKMLSVDVINDSTQARTALNMVDVVQSRIDYVFLTILIGLTLAILITSWFIAGNPIYAFIFFIVLIIAVFIGVIMANVWDDFGIKAPIFNTAKNAMPITNHILNNLPYYISIIGILSLIVMFAKPYLLQRF